MALQTHIELDAGAKTFATGLLIELIAALRRVRPGDLIAVIGSDRTVGTESKLGVVLPAIVWSTSLSRRAAIVG